MVGMDQKNSNISDERDIKCCKVLVTGDWFSNEFQIEDVDHAASWVILVNVVCRSGAHATNCSVMDHNGVPSEHDDAIHVFLGELEMLCVVVPETKVGWKFRRRTNLLDLLKHFLFSVQENLCSSRSQARKFCIITHSQIDNSFLIFVCCVPFSVVGVLSCAYR